MNGDLYKVYYTSYLYDELETASTIFLEDLEVQPPVLRRNQIVMCISDFELREYVRVISTVGIGWVFFSHLV